MHTAQVTKIMTVKVKLRICHPKFSFIIINIIFKYALLYLTKRKKNTRKR